MKNYLIRTLIVSLPEQPSTALTVVTLPNNAIPVGIEVRPLYMPGSLFLHYLTLSDEEGNPIEEVVTTNIYEIAWKKLGQFYGEHSNEENLDIMDSVMKGVVSETEGEAGARKEAEQES